MVATPERPPHWPLRCALAVLAAVTAVLFAGAFASAHGGFAYPLDDSYIHLTIARNLVENGTWGVAPGQTASASSSPLWVLLLAGCMLVTGPWLHAPLLLAALAAAALLVIVDGVWRHGALTARARGIGLLALLFTAALPAMVLTGMEHCLHAMLTVAFAAAGAAAGGPGAPARAARTALLLAPLLVATRLEGAALVALLAATWWRRLGLRPAALLLLAGLLPIAVLAAWSAARGAPWLPNPVLIKALVHGGLDEVPALLRGLHRLIRHELFAAMLVAVIALRFLVQRRTSGLVLPFVVALLAHAQFARFGHMARYDAYLIALGITALLPLAGAGLAAGGRTRIATIVLLCLVTVAAFEPVWKGLRDPIAASRHVRLQQAAIAQFLREHYAGRSVAMNDIGAMNWFAPLRPLDLWGLGDDEVARAHSAGRFDAAFVSDLAARRAVAIAVIYERAVPVPANWLRAGTWTVDDAYWGPTVTFFAVDPAEAPRLRSLLAAHQANLPPGARIAP